MSVISQFYSVIIDRGISATGHGKEVVDGLNAIYKRYIYQLMSYVQLLRFIFLFTDYNEIFHAKQ